MIFHQISFILKNYLASCKNLNNVLILHNKLPVMKKTLLGSFILLFFSFQSFSQLLSWSPDFIQESSTPVVITMDATKGNQGLLKLYPHF